MIYYQEENTSAEEIERKILHSNESECHVKKIANDVFECLSERVKECPYAMPFGNSFFCLDPKVRKLSERTSKFVF
jgi:hypothetical protein